VSRQEIPLLVLDDRSSDDSTGHRGLLVAGSDAQSDDAVMAV
jgi:hypothetical protein